MILRDLVGVMNGDADYLQRRQSLEPRYTQRLVYEQEAGLPFTLCLVGTRGELRAGTGNGKQRLGDFRRLDLQRQQNTDLQRGLVMEIRKTQFREKSSDRE